MKKNDCPSCNGKGHKWDYYRDCVRKCCDCDGSGKLDWFEQIFGKNRKLDPPEEMRYIHVLYVVESHTHG